MSVRSKQARNGKAFEYALLTEMHRLFTPMTSVVITDNSSYKIAQDCFLSIPKTERESFQFSARAGVSLLSDLEPRLGNRSLPTDVLNLEITGDERGKEGDVRDILMSRVAQDWCIGVSAKNNDDSAKHSRLSPSIDFGQKWLRTPCSATYFEEISPVFSRLFKIRKEGKGKTLWKEIGNYHAEVYFPILSAFSKELKRLIKTPESASSLLYYLIGREDFYKVVRRKKSVTVKGMNLQGSLNSAFNDQVSELVVPKLPLPTALLFIGFKEDSSTTLIVKLDHEWELSMRIHNASSKVEPSLKFDVDVVRQPSSMFINVIQPPLKN